MAALPRPQHAHIAPARNTAYTADGRAALPLSPNTLCQNHAPWQAGCICLRKAHRCKAYQGGCWSSATRNSHLGTLASNHWAWPSKPVHRPLSTACGNLQIPDPRRQPRKCSTVGSTVVSTIDRQCSNRLRIWWLQSAPTVPHSPAAAS